MVCLYETFRKGKAMVRTEMSGFRGVSGVGGEGQEPTASAHERSHWDDEMF